MRTKRSKPEALDLPEGGIAVAWQGAAWENYVVSTGDRLRSDHPMVKALGRSAFVPDGLPRGEWPNVLDDVIAEAEAAPVAPKPPPPIAPATPVSELVICVRGIIASKVGSVPQGTVVHKDDRRVAAVPEAWKPLVDTLAR